MSNYDSTENIARNRAMWDAAPTTFAEAPLDPHWYVEGPSKGDLIDAMWMP